MHRNTTGDVSLDVNNSVFTLHHFREGEYSSSVVK